MLEANGISIEPSTSPKSSAASASCRRPPGVAKLDGDPRLRADQGRSRGRADQDGQARRVIDDWMRETEVAISAVQCWTALEEFSASCPAP
jgi:hypothetical protein